MNDADTNMHLHGKVPSPVAFAASGDRIAQSALNNVLNQDFANFQVNGGTPGDPVDVAAWINSPLSDPALDRARRYNATVVPRHHLGTMSVMVNWAQSICHNYCD